MLTSTMPRSSPPRATHTPHALPISYPVSSLRPSSQTTIIAPASPPTTPPRGRRPSISNTMHWLSRSSTQSSSSSPYAPSKPTRISEPKIVRSIELMSQHRSGVLGSGATVVRTPDDALRETGVRLTFDGKPRDNHEVSDGPPTGESSYSQDEPISPKSSPLPPLPPPEEEESQYLEAEIEAPKLPPRPTRSPPSVPLPAPSPTLRPALKAKSVLNADSESIHVPPLPANMPSSLPPPPFKPILVSEVPTGAVDLSKIIVTLETCTTSYRTTLDTLQSRSSHLSNYLSSLFPRPRGRSVASSIYSTASEDMSTYQHHLTSQGLLSQSSFSIHIFLDRPSAPYAHILNYLRSPVGSLEAPESLPRAVQLQTSSHSRLESLLELRDEAAYLNLEGLQKLCTDEIRLRHGTRLHTRGHSGASTAGSIHSLHASVYSLHALLERVESDMRPNQRNSNVSDSKSSKDIPNEMGVLRSPPTPQSWNGPFCERSEEYPTPSRSPPAGWI